MLFQYPHKANTRRQLFAVKPQAQVIGAGMAGQKLFQQFLQVGASLGCGKVHLSLDRWCATKEIGLYLLRFGTQCLEAALLLLNRGIHRLIDFQQAAKVISPLERSQDLVGELSSNPCLSFNIGSKLNQGWIVIRKIRKPQVGSHEIQLFWLHLRT